MGEENERKRQDYRSLNNKRSCLFLVDFVAVPATSAFSALSLVAYLTRIRSPYRLPEGSLLDKSLLAHCLVHPLSPPLGGHHITLVNLSIF